MTVDRVRKTVLKNGLRVVSENLPDRDSVTIGVWVEAGSRNEAGDVAGVSHFLEHMVFKGTQKRSARELALAVERLGGTLNAFTSREHTCFHARVLHSDLANALDILADLTTRAKIPALEVKKERRVIAEEIKDAHDTPNEWVHELFWDQLWPELAIGRPIAGSIPTVMEMTRRNLTDHRRLFYRPERMLIAACGKLSHDRLVRQARKVFQFEPSTKPVPEIVSPDGITVRCGVDQRDIKQTHVCLGFPTWGFADKRRYTTLLTSSLLGGGMSSRLFQSVREKRGLVYAVYTFHDALYDAGFFGVYFACDPAQLINATNLILDEMGKLTRGGVTQTEITDTKAQLRGNLLMGLESIPPRMHRLARHELYLGGHIPAEQTLRSINRVKAADVTAFANEVFQPDRLAMAVLGPVQPEILTKVGLEKLLPAKRRRKKA